MASNARTLAKLASSPFSDGQIEITEIENITVNHNEINHLAGVTHNIQDQITELDDENLLNLGV